jgi:hypothetical protein
LFSFAISHILTLSPSTTQPPTQGEDIMMARRASQGQLDSAAVLNEIKRHDLISVADDLALLSDGDFIRVIEAFRIYRRSVILDGSLTGAGGGQRAPQRRALHLA